MKYVKLLLLSGLFVSLGLATAQAQSSDLALYGIYEIDYDHQIEIWERGGELVIGRMGFPQRSTLKPAGDLVFKGEGGYPQITFSKTPKGNIKSMTLISYEGDEPLEGFRLVLPAVVDEGGTKFFLEGHEDAKFVSIGGFFNGWNVWDMPLKKTDQGWEGTLDLPPGRYPYKFIVDGVWTVDPNNTATEDDGYGNINSLRVIE